jgi:hypothetical protein
MKVLIVFLLVAWPRGAYAEVVCVPGGLKALAALLEQKPAEELVFFASWCRSCKPHIENLQPDQVLIASFDEQVAAEKVVRLLSKGGQQPRCLWDEGNEIAEHYGVKGLPASRKVRP